ncbi:MAG: glutamine amidotransferase-related protein, partial [Candidatus Gastranaerophilaceae bacterium]
PSIIFNNISPGFSATRYHSLVVKRETFPEELEITASTNDGIIMGLQHKHLPVYGVQFHPEAILTEYGKELLKNFISADL